MAKAAVEGSVSHKQSYSITRLHSTAPISRRRLEEARHQLSIATGTISLLAHTLLGSCSYISINTTSKSTSTTTTTTYSCGLPVCRRSLIDCITSTVILYQLSSLNSVNISRSPALLRCSRCKSIHYCTADHQRQHWGKHKVSEDE